MSRISPAHRELFSVKYLGSLTTTIFPYRCLMVNVTAAVFRNDIYRRLA